jgi:PAS domain S-box-containing protein
MQAQDDVTGTLDAKTQLKILNTLAVELINHSDKGQLAWYVAREIVHKLGFSDCVIYYIDENGKNLHQVAAIGAKNPKGNVILNPLRIPLGDGVCGEVAQTGLPLLIEDLKGRDNYIVDLEEGVSELCVPLIFEGDIWGVIDSENYNVSFYTPDHLEILTSIAALMASKLSILHKNQTLKDSEKRNRMIFSSSLEGIITFDNSGQVLECNLAAQKIFNKSEKMAKSVSISHCFSTILDPSPYNDAKAWITDLIQITGLGARTEQIAKRSSEEMFECELTLNSYDLDGSRFFTAFIRDISQSKKTERERLQALQDAEHASKAKSEFLAIMSHELRTPLNAIIGFSDILSSEIFGPVGSPKYLEYSKDISSGGNHLLKLVNDILDLSAIESNKISHQKEWLQVREAITDSCALISGQAAQRKITFSSDISDNLPPLFADKTSLNQIIINLLSNAIKFTPEKGRVSLKIRSAYGHHIIEVSDNGKGFPTDDTETLLAPFTRGEDSAHKAQEGSGLGLAIVKSLVELHKGELEIHSSSGVGATVRVILPTTTE